MYLIKIDKRTIKKNKIYGVSEFRTYFGSQMTLETDEEIKNKNFRWIETNCEGFSNRITYKYINDNKKSFMAWLRNKRRQNKDKRYKWSIEHFYDTHTSFYPDSRKYIYFFCNPNVICKHCKKQFKFKQLSDDYNDDGYKIREDYCPHCQEENCIDYEYQKIEEITKSF